MESNSSSVVECLEIRPGRPLHILQRRKDGESSRPTMLFLHGAGGRKEQWEAQVEHFQETHNIIAYDILGHGQNDKGPKPSAYVTSELVRDLHAIVQRFVDPTLSANVLAAHSYGTVIALKFLSSLQSGNLEGADQSGEREENGPEYFKSAVLIGASAERPAGSSHPIWHAPFFGVAGHL